MRCPRLILPRRLGPIPSVPYLAAGTLRRRRRLAGMAKPVIVVVDDEDDSLAALARELESRYGAHYLVVACSSPGQALVRLAELRAEGARVPLVLADQWMADRRARSSWRR
jgi:PleD family two-component response regulator